MILVLGASTGLAADARAAQLPPCLQSIPSNAEYWSDYFPTLAAGEVAVIQENDLVYLNVDTVDLSFLEIRGTLVWDHCFQDLELRAAAILVRDSGEFQIGSALTPFPHQATVTLIDWPLVAVPAEVNDYTPEVRDALDDRGFVVSNGGTLRIHGKIQDKSWTRLAASADPLATQITVADSGLPWEAGQEIVIASTDFDQNQAEVHEIIAPNLAVIGLVPGSALAHLHYGQGQNFDPLSMGDPAWNVEERAEVGLLSRNVVIQGEKDAGALNSPEHYGHVFFCMDLSAVPSVEVEWASFQNLGVGGVTGRYPVHFHQLGDPGTVPLQIKHCSVRDTWNRGIVLHDTQKVILEDNVIHNTIGYGIYVETPATIDNHLIGNLVLTNRVYENPQGGAVFDTDPGNLVLKSLQNQVVGNVAAGSEQYGIYYQLSTANTHDLQFFEFSGNVAHSAGKIGIFLNDAIKTDSEPTFLNSAVWKVREHGMWIRSLSGYLVDGLIASDCRSGFYPASLGIRAAGEGHQVLRNGLFVGETDNFGTLDPQKGWEVYAERSLPQDQPEFPDHELIWDPLNGIEVYDGFVEIEDCRFARFKDRIIPPIEPSWTIRRHAAGLTQVAKYSTWINDPRNRVRELSFRDDVDRRIWFRTPLDGQNQIAFTTIVDEDNSIGFGSGTDPMILFPNMPFSKHGANTAVFRADLGSTGLNGYSVPYADAQYGQLVVEINSPAGPPGVQTHWQRVVDPLGTADEGPIWPCETVPTHPASGGNGHYRFPVVLEVGALGLPAAEVRYYAMEYPAITSGFPKSLDLAYRFAQDEDRTVFVEIPYDQGSLSGGAPGTVLYFDEDEIQQQLQEKSDLNALLSTSDEQAWTHVSGILYLKLTSILDNDLLLVDGTETKWWIRQ